MVSGAVAVSGGGFGKEAGGGGDEASFCNALLYILLFIFIGSVGLALTFEILKMQNMVKPIADTGS